MEAEEAPLNGTPSCHSPMRAEMLATPVAGGAWEGKDVALLCASEYIVARQLPDLVQLN